MHLGARVAVAFVPLAAVTLAAQANRPLPQVDPKALALLEAMDNAFTRAEGLTAAYRNESYPPGNPAGGETTAAVRPRIETTVLRLGRPNVYYVETTSGPSRRILASNGASRFMVSGGANGAATCRVSAVVPLNDAREIDTFNPVYWSFYDLGQWQIRSAALGHWSTQWRMHDPDLRTLRYIGRAIETGAPMDIVEWTYTIGYNRKDDDPVYTTRLALDADRFIRRIETSSASKDPFYGRHVIETISDLEVTPRPSPDAFAYRPPDGATCAPYDEEAAYVTGKYADLPIGSKAPDFELKTANGGTFRLSTYLRQHKVVLMNFWGYG